VIWEFMAKSGKSLKELIAEVYEITGLFAFERVDLHLEEAVKNKVVENCKSGKYNSFGKYKVLRMDDLDAAIEVANKSIYGNGAAIFTRSGKAAREFKHRIQAGMIGINVGVPAAMAHFPFSGWGESFFGDLHVQGREGVYFYTQQKVTTTRWFAEGEGDIWRK